MLIFFLVGCFQSKTFIQKPVNIWVLACLQPIFILITELILERYKYRLNYQNYIIGYLEVTYNVCFVSYKLISKFIQFNA